LHICLTRGFSDRLFDRGKDATLSIFCANIAAGFMVSQFAKYLRRLPVDPDIQINLLSNEMTVASC